MSRFCPLFSGSSGNCTYIGTPESGILVDAGCSCKSVIAALESTGIDPATIRAIFVTHEHFDHICGVRVLAKKLGIPIVASAETLSALQESGVICGSQNFVAIDGSTEIEGFPVTRFATSHDCPGSSGYVFSLPDGRKAAVCTDLGYVSDEVKKSLCGCDIVLIESNHDVNMLKKGSYPYPLKQRILSEHGHLSNNDCASLLPFLVKSGTTRIILAHLSRENNLPALALSSSKAALIDAGYKEELDYIIYAAPVCGGKMFIL